MILLSICIPCYKRVDYLRNTLDSIYTLNSDVPLDEYEVVISDNDPDRECAVFEKEFAGKNLRYFPTECEGFRNSFYALTYGTGDYLLLHNSQELFHSGTVRYIIELLKNSKRCYALFTNGFLLYGKCVRYTSFDDFVYNSSYWSSWSNAFGIWREDFYKVKDMSLLNNLFPHTSLFLTQYYHKDYILCDVPLFETQFVKGRSGHNKFHAFAYEYPMLIDRACKDGHISTKTKERILHDILYKYLPLLYFNVKIAKREYWDSTKFKEDLKLYYPNVSYCKIGILSIIAPFWALTRKYKRGRIIKNYYAHGYEQQSRIPIEGNI